MRIPSTSRSLRPPLTPHRPSSLSMCRRRASARAPRSGDASLGPALTTMHRRRHRGGACASSYVFARRTLHAVPARTDDPFARIARDPRELALFFFCRTWARQHQPLPCSAPGCVHVPNRDAADLASADVRDPCARTAGSYRRFPCLSRPGTALAERALLDATGGSDLDLSTCGSAVLIQELAGNAEETRHRADLRVDCQRHLRLGGAARAVMTTGDYGGSRS